MLQGNIIFQDVILPLYFQMLQMQFFPINILQYPFIHSSSVEFAISVLSFWILR